MKHFNVVCAVVEEGGEVLCMRRPLHGSQSTAGKWEFPGGKVEPGESHADALARELREEMDYEVEVERYIASVNYSYPDFSITLHAYLCTAGTRKFNRKEHINHVWLPIAELEGLDWAAADHDLIDIIKKDTNL